MIRVVELPNVLDAESRRVHEFAWRGLNAREYVRQIRPDWKRFVVVLRDRHLSEHELDLVLADGVEIVIAPMLSGPAIPYIIATVATLILVLSVASIAYSIYLLVAGSKTGSTPRDDEQSPTYGANQIQTVRRAGYPRPIAFGLHRLGGTMLYTDVVADGGQQEYLHVILGLCEGPIHSIGGIEGGPLGEVDDLGWLNEPLPPDLDIPEGIMVSGNLLEPGKQGCKAYLRMGRIEQSPFPNDVFPGAAVTQFVGLDLKDYLNQVITTISSTDTIGSIGCVIAFPNGLVQLTGNGTPIGYAVNFLLRYRKVGTTRWFDGLDHTVDVGPRLSGFAVSLRFQVNPSFAATGPLEVMVLRRTPAGNQAAQSLANFRQVVYAFPHTFSHPRQACLGLVVAAPDKITGGEPNFSILGKWKTVRVYDDVLGISEDRYWELPEAGDDYEGIWANPPGRNPAWILAEFLTMRAGLGRLITDAQIDWPTIRDWADFCDEMVPLGAGEEARCQCDLVIDAPQSAWDVVLQICRTGRAVPIRIGTKISVKYEYRDGHGAGSNVVPAKARTAILNTANVTDFEVQFLDPSTRPAILDIQILNEELDYKQDVVSVEIPETDPDTPNDPTVLNPIAWKKQAIQLYGVCRASQARREGRFGHRLNRLARFRGSCKAGPETLSVTIGDIVGLQHDTLLPFVDGSGNPEESFGMRLSHAHSAASTIRLDHSVTLFDSKQYQAIVRTDHDTVQEVPLAPGIGSPGGTTFPPGTHFSIGGSALTAPKGAPVTFGVEGKEVVDAIVVGVSLAADMTRVIQFMHWVPDAYDDENVGDGIADEAEGDELMPQGVVYNLTQALPAPAPSITAAHLAGGITRLGWEAAAGYQGSRTRVYRRKPGTAGWTQVGEYRGEHVDLPAIGAGESYQFAVANEDRHGNFAGPDEGSIVTVVGQEFPAAEVPDINNASIQRVRDDVLLRWDPVEGFAFAYYEVLRGSELLGAELIYRGSEPWCWHRSPPVGDLRYIVRVRATHGLYSPTPAVLEIAAAPPENALLLAEVDETTDPAGTIDGLDHVDAANSPFTHTGNVREGSYTGVELDGGLGGDALLYWSVYWRAWWEDAELTFADLEWAAGSGEGRWWTWSGRPASAALPGVAWDGPASELTAGTWADIDDELLRAKRGHAGEHAVAIVESRFYIGDAWTDWAPHVNGWRTAEKMQARVLMKRESPRLALSLTDFTQAVYQ